MDEMRLLDDEKDTAVSENICSAPPEAPTAEAFAPVSAEVLLDDVGVAESCAEEECAAEERATASTAGEENSAEDIAGRTASEAIPEKSAPEGAKVSSLEPASAEAEPISEDCGAPAEAEPATADGGAPAEALPEESAPEKKSKRAGGKRSRREKKQYVYAEKDRLICAIASSVAAALALAFIYLLASALAETSRVIEALGDAPMLRRILGSFANLLIVLGVGSGAMSLSAVAGGFAKRAHKGCESRLRPFALALRILPLVIFIAAIAIMASAIMLLF